ncbi:MAG: YihY/virulence factor BrkB family protein [Sphingobacteriales bacterium]|nr:MAG: YihY/virulence factor BrkB family protein [Sphingobacteriales bacterium]
MKDYSPQKTSTAPAAEEIQVQPAARLLPRLARWVGNSSPPGFGGLTLKGVGRKFFSQLAAAQLNVRSAAVTYNFLMAIPPTMLILFSLVPYLPLDDVEGTILSLLPIIFPDADVAASIRSVVSDFLNTQQGSILSFGVLLTAFFASNGMMGLMRSFDQQTPVYKKRSGLKRRWIAIKLTFMLLATVLVTAAALLIQGKYLTDYMLRLTGGSLLVHYASPIAVAILVFVSICMVYRYGSSLVRKPKFISPGSVLATFLCLLVTVVFFYLVNNFIHYNKVYGSIGTLIAFMVWVYLITFTILLGFEFNVSILSALEHEKASLAADNPVTTPELNTD